MPGISTGDRLALTSAVNLLDAKVMPGVTKLYENRQVLRRFIRQRGEVVPCRARSIKRAFEFERSWNAGPALSGEDLWDEVPSVGGADVRNDEERGVVQIFLTNYYAGIRIDGVVAEAAADRSASFSDLVRPKIRNATDNLMGNIEFGVNSDGRGILATVASVAGAVVTVDVSNETIANAGQFGTRYLGKGRVVCALDPDTGLVIGSATYRIVAKDKANGTVTLDRTPTSWADGHVIVAARSPTLPAWNRHINGIVAAVGNATDALEYGSLSRVEHPELEAHVVDATQNSQLGEVSRPLIHTAWTEANEDNDGMPSILYTSPKVKLEAFYGQEIGAFNTAPNVEVRQRPGMQGDILARPGGRFRAGHNGIEWVDDVLGTLDVVVSWDCRRNTVFLIDPSSMEWIEAQEGVKMLDGFALGGAFVRVSKKDVYDAYMRWRGQLFCKAPNKNARINNVLEQA